MGTDASAKRTSGKWILFSFEFAFMNAVNSFVLVALTGYVLLFECWQCNFFISFPFLSLGGSGQMLFLYS